MIVKLSEEFEIMLSMFSLQNFCRSKWHMWAKVDVSTLGIQSKIHLAMRTVLVYRAVTKYVTLKNTLVYKI